MKITKNRIEFEDNDKVVQTLDNIHKDLLHVLNQIYYTTAKIDLQKDFAYLLQSKGYADIIGYPFKWTEYLENTAGLYLPNEKTRVLKELSCQNLMELCKKGEKLYTTDALYIKNGVLSSMKIMCFLEYENDVPVAYIATRNSSAECLRNHIVNQYVYNNCDYFCYLDVKHNSYEMFSTTNNGTPLPPIRSENYTTDMIIQAKETVVPEDLDFVIREMSLERVLSQLGKKEYHSFYYGVQDPVRGYTRKRLEYRFYERSTQMVLFSRTDVTDIYLEEESKRKALIDALKRAETDGLTGLLNYQGLKSNISAMLEQNSMQAALLFVDLDNFKAVNDTFGHDVGNQALCDVASILKQASFGAPVTGRVGGDEFVVFLPHFGVEEEVKGYAEYLCEAISKLIYEENEKQICISSSIGIAKAPVDGITFEELTKKADQMAYYIKEHGKNGYAVYDSII